MGKRREEEEECGGAREHVSLGTGRLMDGGWWMVDGGCGCG